jgi:hypothetical protein
MIKKIIIAAAFPLSLKAQSDTTVIPDSVRVVRIQDVKAVLATIEDKVTVKEYKVINAFIDAVFRRAISDYKPKISSK